MVFLAVFLSLARAAEPADLQTLHVPLIDVLIDEALIGERPTWSTSVAEPPLAWSQIGDYAVGEPYVLTHLDGAVALTCTIRSFALRPAAPGSSWAQGAWEVWADLHCPLEIVAYGNL